MSNNFGFPEKPYMDGHGALGDLWYQGPNGIWVAIPIPADWATVTYELTIIDGVPAWAAKGVLRVPFIASTAQLFAPEVFSVVGLNAIGSTAVLYPPALPLLLAASHIASTVQLFAPTMATDQSLTGSTIASGSQLFAPTTGWVPSDEPGLIFWWKMYAGNNTIDSQPPDVFTTFFDQSGNGNHGSWTGARALVETNGLGSLTVADFWGAPIYQLPSGSFSGKTAAHIFMKLKLNLDPGDGNANHSGIWIFGSDTTNPDAYVDNIGGFYTSFGHSTRYITAVNPAATITDWHRFALAASSSGYDWRINDVSQASGATSVGSSWLTQPWFGGANFGFTEWRLYGKVAEVFCYDHVLDATARANADAYLAALGS